MRYKYPHILQECNKKYMYLTVMDMGHSLYEWSWTSSEFLIGRSRTLSIFNTEMIVQQLRRLIGFLTTTFEQMPLQRLVAVNSMPGKLSLETLYKVDKFISNLTKFYMLRYLPGTFSSRFVMYHYWYRRLYKRLRNQQSREWRAYNRATMVRISWVPDLVILFGAANESFNLVREIDSLMIPSVILLDSNASPVGTFYPLRGSDDNIRIFKYLSLIFGTCIGFGKELAFYSFEKYFDLNRSIQVIPEHIKQYRKKSRKIKKVENMFGQFFKIIKKRFKQNYRATIGRQFKKIKKVRAYENFQKLYEKDSRLIMFTNKFSVVSNSIQYFMKRRDTLENEEYLNISQKNKLSIGSRNVHFMADFYNHLHLTFATLKEATRWNGVERLKKHYSKRSNLTAPLRILEALSKKSQKYSVQLKK